MDQILVLINEIVNIIYYRSTLKTALFTKSQSAVIGSFYFTDKGHSSGFISYSTSIRRENEQLSCGFYL